MPHWAFLLSLHLHTTRQPLPLGDNLFPGSASLCSPLHPHRHPLSHFPKQKNTFFWGSFLSLPWLLKNPKFNLKNPYHSNLPCQSHSLFSLFLLPALKHTRANTHACTDTNTHLFEIHISSNTNARLPISNTDTFTERNTRTRGPISTHKHTCTHACEIISLPKH